MTTRSEHIEPRQRSKSLFYGSDIDYARVLAQKQIPGVLYQLVLTWVWDVIWCCFRQVARQEFWLDLDRAMRLP